MAARKRAADPCSIARALEVLGERWAFLIMREALGGTTRFSDFQDALGIAPDVLTARLATLVDAGVLSRDSYREPGARPRPSYHLTAAGADLQVVLGALQQWGDDHRPRPEGPTRLRRTSDDRPVRVAFVDDRDRVLDPGDVRFLPVNAG
jgi:DNA-binding HxlR family transcriptional regulator